MLAESKWFVNYDSKVFGTVHVLQDDIIKRPQPSGGGLQVRYFQGVTVIPRFQVCVSVVAGL